MVYGPLNNGPLNIWSPGFKMSRLSAELCCCGITGVAHFAASEYHVELELPVRISHFL